MELVKINMENFATEVLKSDKPVLLDMYATWCGPCSRMAPELEEFAECNDEFKVCKMDVDECMDLAVTFGVLSVPTVIMFKDGKETDRFVGGKDYDGIMEFCGL